MPAKAERPQDCGMIRVAGQAVAFTVMRSRRRRRTVAMSLDDKGVRILAPLHTSASFLRHFMESRVDWIAKRLAEQAQHTHALEICDGGTVPYLGHSCSLRIGHGLPAACRLRPGQWILQLPPGLTESAAADEARLELRLWFKRRARIVLRRRLDLWAIRMGVTYAGFKLSDAERRWGSCSTDDRIRLNWRLMMAPLPLLDYVVAHELAHVAHKDHSPRFWAFLAQAMPDYKIRRRQLRALERTLLFV